MHILIVKTSSLGDIIHTLPALTDAAAHIKDISFDWVVEKNFAAIPSLHPRVKKVIPCESRLWGKNPWRNRHKWKRFKQELRQNKYDLVIDAQGLLKSAAITYSLPAPIAGYNYKAARESWASLLYNHKYYVSKSLHAITRIRSLFAQALNYTLENQPVIDYGLESSSFPSTKQKEKYVVLLHATTWRSKEWPLKHWQSLVCRLAVAGYLTYIPWGNAAEKKRAEIIGQQLPTSKILPKSTLFDLAAILVGASGVVAVDTGLAHLAAAFDIPTISLYGPTNHNLTGCLGKNQHHLMMAKPFSCVPCLARKCTHKQKTFYASCLNAVNPEIVLNKLFLLINEQDSPAPIISPNKYLLAPTIVITRADN